MDEQMNRHLNQWMDEELEDFQDFSFSYKIGRAHV